MASHRYWRLLIPAAARSSNYAQISELELRESIGGSSVASGGTASASSTMNATYAASKAFDGSHTSGNAWSSITYGTDWLKYDFGAGNEKDIVEIKLYTPDSSGGSINPGAFPKYAVFQYSDDDVTWVDHLYIGGMEQSYNKSYVFNTSTNAPSNIVTSRLLDAEQKNFIRKTPFTGDYCLSGVTTNMATPAPRQICLYDQASRQLIATTHSKADGVFEFDYLANREFVVIGVDDSGTQNDIVYSHITPVPR